MQMNLALVFRKENRKERKKKIKGRIAQAKRPGRWAGWEGESMDVSYWVLHSWCRDSNNWKPERWRDSLGGREGCHDSTKYPWASKFQMGPAPLKHESLHHSEPSPFLSQNMSQLSLTSSYPFPTCSGLNHGWQKAQKEFFSNLS